jgi:hypothetical protein
MKILLQTQLWHPSYAKIQVILSKCDNVIEKHSNTYVILSLFFGLKICTNVKFKYGKRIFYHFFEKKTNRFAKN